MQIGWLMKVVFTAIEIENHVRAAGLTMSQVCEHAGVAPSIFSRWKSGDTRPNIDNYERIVVAARALAPGLGSLAA